MALAWAMWGPSPAFADSANHAIAMHGEPALPADFKHFQYVNPDAPKGGRLIIGLLGSFDSLNPYVVRGEAVMGLRTYVYAPLMQRNQDEPFTLYPLIAEKIDVPDDRSSVTFYINPRAKFSDGHAVTVDDVIFSWELLKDKGWPNQRTHYAKVEKVERVGSNGVKFSFPNANDRELPLIMALLMVLPKHAIDPEKFDQATLEKPIAAGPYVVTDMKVGTSLTLKRVQDWWGDNLPSNKGMYNFDEIRYEFYRDNNSLFEAFKKGLVDMRAEDDPAKWSRDYDFPAVKDGRVTLETIPTGMPRTLQTYVFNTRRDIFADVRVREALVTLFDFEWMNKNLFRGAYERTESLFHGSELAAFQKPASPLEKSYLQHANAKLAPEFLDGTWKLAATDGTARDRTLLRAALNKFEDAGWVHVNGKLVNRKTGQPFTFEVMANTRDEERVLLSWKKTLDQAGIDMRIRQVDSAQAERRRQTYDFDMTKWNYISSLSPGNEQAIRWGSKTATQPGSVNLAGVKDPAVDALLEKLVAAKTREELVSASRALDRVLMAGYYMLPLYNIPAWHIAHWSRVKIPAKPALAGSMMETWWYTNP
ncbi:MAG: extracellular solute-binding protein [Pseudomonadota bacterium]